MTGRGSISGLRALVLLTAVLLSGLLQPAPGHRFWDSGVAHRGDTIKMADRFPRGAVSTASVFRHGLDDAHESQEKSALVDRRNLFLDGATEEEEDSKKEMGFRDDAEAESGAAAESEAGRKLRHVHDASSHCPTRIWELPESIQAGCLCDSKNRDGIHKGAAKATPKWMTRKLTLATQGYGSVMFAARARQPTWAKRALLKKFNWTQENFDEFFAIDLVQLEQQVADHFAKFLGKKCMVWGDCKVTDHGVRCSRSVPDAPLDGTCNGTSSSHVSRALAEVSTGSNASSSIDTVLHVLRQTPGYFEPTPPEQILGPAQVFIYGSLIQFSADILITLASEAAGKATAVLLAEAGPVGVLLGDAMAQMVVGRILNDGMTVVTGWMLTEYVTQMARTDADQCWRTYSGPCLCQEFQVGTPCATDCEAHVSNNLAVCLTQVKLLQKVTKGCGELGQAQANLAFSAQGLLSSVGKLLKGIAKMKAAADNPYKLYDQVTEASGLLPGNAGREVPSTGFVATMQAISLALYNGDFLQQYIGDRVNAMKDCMTPLPPAEYQKWDPQVDPSCWPSALVPGSCKEAYGNVPELLRRVTRPGQVVYTDHDCKEAMTIGGGKVTLGLNATALYTGVKVKSSKCKDAAVVCIERGGQNALGFVNASALAYLNPQCTIAGASCRWDSQGAGAAGVDKCCQGSCLQQSFQDGGIGVCSDNTTMQVNITCGETFGADFTCVDGNCTFISQPIKVANKGYVIIEYYTYDNPDRITLTAGGKKIHDTGWVGTSWPPDCSLLPGMPQQPGNVNCVGFNCGKPAIKKKLPAGVSLVTVKAESHCPGSKWDIRITPC